jgi:hypothetical protein
VLSNNNSLSFSLDNYEKRINYGDQDRGLYNNVSDLHYRLTIGIDLIWATNSNKLG